MDKLTEKHYKIINGNIPYGIHQGYLIQASKDCSQITEDIAIRFAEWVENKSMANGYKVLFKQFKQKNNL